MPITLPCTRPTVAVAAAVIGTAAPAAYAVLDAEPSATVAGGRQYRETRLLFGTVRPRGGPAVTDRQFAGFIDRYVTPAFPEGLTVRPGQGQWRDSTACSHPRGPS